MTLHPPSRTSTASPSLAQDMLATTHPSQRQTSLEFPCPSDAPSKGSTLPSRSSTTPFARCSGLTTLSRDSTPAPYPPSPFFTTLTVSSSPGPAVFFNCSRPWGSVPRLPLASSLGFYIISPRLAHQVWEGLTPHRHHVAWSRPADEKPCDTGLNLGSRPDPFRIGLGTQARSSRLHCLE